MQDNNDDGSLSCLMIPMDESNRHFNCEVTTQQKLVNLSFWVIDFIPEVRTKHGEGRALVKIKMNKEDKDSDAKKFFTNSQEMKYILTKIKDMKKFPRKVTLKASGPRYFFE